VTRIEQGAIYESECCGSGLFVVFLGPAMQVPEWSEQDRALPSSLEAEAVLSAELETERNEARRVPACVCAVTERAMLEVCPASPCVV
jgi:hypothetical protein